MNRANIIQIIQQIAGSANAFDKLEEYIAPLPQGELSVMLLTCGVIPEAFAHDSSEEKLWAKYCDILLSQALRGLQLNAEVFRTRGDSADVFAKTAEYSIVADAKAFRLSRTAKNQKDFKIHALDDWRRDHTFACLIAPLYQYPAAKSQIYQQAHLRNVTLLSYIHLKLLLDHAPTTSLLPLWRVAQSNTVPNGDARSYWQAVDAMILILTQVESEQLRAYKQLETTTMQAIGGEEIAYWVAKRDQYHTLTQHEAIERLIKAEKLRKRSTQSQLPSPGRVRYEHLSQHSYAG